MNRVIAIVGATASGKSEAAVLLAKRFAGEVINADSRLFYRGMEIGTARPPDEIMRAAPHHLVGFLDPSETFNLASFIERAGRLITEINGRSRLPLVTGGTGQYTWGLLEGWKVPQVPPDEDLRQRLESRLSEAGVDGLFEELKALDPQAAETVDPRNPRRIIRAIERLRSGAGDSAPAADDPGYDSMVLGLYVERAELHRRIEARVDGMLKAGWLAEVSALVESGVDFNLPALSAIGYRELAAVVRGEIAIAEARERTIRATNRLVRHQNNWFKRHDARITWVDVTDGDVERTETPVAEWLRI